jgi:hypothetical protein
VPIVLKKSGNLNLLETSGPVKACNRIDLPLPLPLWCKTAMKIAVFWAVAPYSQIKALTFREDPASFIIIIKGRAIPLQAWTGLDRLGQARTGPDRPGQARTGPDRPGQAWTGPDGSRSLRLPDVKTIGT